MHGRGGVDAPAEHLQGVARQSEQGVHITVVEVGQQLLGLLLHHCHQVLLLPPPHQGGGGANAGRREESVPGEEASFGASLVFGRDGREESTSHLPPRHSPPSPPPAQAE